MAKNKGAGDTEPAETKILEKVEHKNIFEALAAFQAENPTIKRSKEFGKEGDKMHWWYAPLDEVLTTVRPLTARHGLAFTWEEGKNPGEMVCALYHETYETTSNSQLVSETESKEEHITQPVIRRNFSSTEVNVIRSMPIKVRRTGDMKDVGADSTYARRTTLSETLGIAPDDDKDAQVFTEARREQAENAMFGRVKGGIEKAKSVKELDASAKVLKQNFDDIKAGKVPQLGLSEEQIVELQLLVEEVRKAIGTEASGRGAPGENKDGGGEGTIQHPDESMLPLEAPARVPKI